MKTTAVLIITLNMAILFITGCGPSSNPYAPVKKLFQPSPDTDVTLSQYYNFPSFSGTVWQTKVKSAIAEGKRYTGAPETTLITPRNFDRTAPDYTSADVKIITVLPVGTRLRIERLMRDNGAWGGVNVTVSIQDGTNTQKTVFLDSGFLANNKYLVSGPGAPTNWAVNPEMLEAVKDSPK